MVKHSRPKAKSTSDEDPEFIMGTTHRAKRMRQVEISPMKDDEYYQVESSEDSTSNGPSDQSSDGRSTVEIFTRRSGFANLESLPDLRNNLLTYLLIVSVLWQGSMKASRESLKRCALLMSNCTTRLWPFSHAWRVRWTCWTWQWTPLGVRDARTNHFVVSFWQLGERVGSHQVERYCLVPGELPDIPT